MKNFNKPIIKKEMLESFKVRISQIPPFDVAFKEMALSDYEMLVATIYRLNELIEINQEYIDLTVDVLDWVMNDGLSIAVLERLTEWLNDGTLEELINDTLFKRKLDKVVFETFKEEEYDIFKLYVEGRIAELSLNKVDKEQLGNSGAGKIPFRDEEGKLNIDNGSVEVETNEKPTSFIIEHEGVIKKQTYVKIREDLVEETEISLTNLKNDFDVEVENIKNTINENENVLNEHLEYSHNLIYGEDKINFMHRGLSKFAPENSNHAFDMAGLMGAKGIELDLWMSSDKVFIVSHDNSLSSMTDISGNISSLTSDVILDATITKGNNVDLYPPSKMQRFEQILLVAQRYGMNVLAEIKPTSLTESDLNLLVDIIKNKNMEKQVALMSFDLNTIEKIRSISDKIVVGYVVNSSAFNQQVATEIKNLKNSFMSVNYVSLDYAKTHLDLANKNNLPITFWTVNDFPVSQKLVEMGVRSITSDFIKGSKPKVVTKHFMLSVNNGVITSDRRFSPEPIRIIPSGTVGVEAHYGIPFAINDVDSNVGNYRRGVASVNMSGSNTTTSTIRASSERPNYLFLNAFDISGAKIDIKSLPNGTYFNVIVVGYDFVA